MTESFPVHLKVSHYQLATPQYKMKVKRPQKLSVSNTMAPTSPASKESEEFFGAVRRLNTSGTSRGVEN